MLSGDFLGINLRDFAIGMQGGFAGVFLLPKPKAKYLLAHGLVGGLFANVGGPWLEAVLEKTASEMCIMVSPEISSDLACFVVGVSAMSVLHLVIRRVESKAKRLKND
jgi:hypothetical protein